MRYENSDKSLFHCLSEHPKDISLYSHDVEYKNCKMYE